MFIRYRQKNVISKKSFYKNLTSFLNQLLVQSTNFMLGIELSIMSNNCKLTEATFKSIYDRLAPKLVAFAKSWSGDKVFAEDVVQDAFLQVWQRKEKLQDAEKIDPLLYTIVRNNLINHYQKKLKQKAYLAELAHFSENGVDSQAESQRLNLVKKQIETLPPRSKEVFLMSRKDGLTYQEIANELSISTKSVEKHISKALKILKKGIKGMYLLFF